MKAVFLAAGAGTRLTGLTTDIHANAERILANIEGYLD